MRGLVLAAFCGAALLTLPAIAHAQAGFGPFTVSIPSTGGYNLCLGPVPDAGKTHYAKSNQGTRHPYRFALYDPSENLLIFSTQITNNDGYFYFGEGVHFTGNSRRTRIDNQAASSGNGQYTCKSEAV